MNIQVREAVVSDYLAIAEISRSEMGYDCSDELVKEKLKNVLGIAVLKEYQNKGVGTLLLNAVEDWAVSTDAYAIRINSGTSRKEAHEFYRSKGYGLEKEQIRFMKMCK